MNLLSFFAHGGEVHETAVEDATHSLLDVWYIALPLYIVLLFGVGAIIYLLSKSKPVTSGVLLAILFVVGVASYSFSAPLSIFSLAVGFGMALFLVLTGLGGPPHGHKTKK